MLNFWEFCNEREAIRVRREAGQPFPWTDNEILCNYRFTNINREHDKGTVLLKQAIAQSAACRSSYENVIHFVSIYRFLGSHLNNLTLADVAPEDRNATMLERYNAGHDMMKMTAYQINVPLGKSPITLAMSLWPTLPAQINKLPKPTGMLSVRAIIGQYTKDIGYHSCWFHGMEIAKDLSMLFSKQYDPQSMIALGPGAIKGIQRLKYDDEDNYSALCRLQNESFAAYPIPLTLSTVEHALCEYNKYCEAYEGRSTRAYKRIL